MLNYILKRLLQMIPTVFGVILLTFALFNIVPGDLAALVLGKNVTPESLETFDELRGLNKPVFLGTRGRTRAYADQDFAEGSGRWRSQSNVVHSAAAAQITLGPCGEINPLSFALDPNHDYEWTIRYRGQGAVAGQVLDSSEWRKVRIRFSGSAPSLFQTGAGSLEIRNLTLRKILKSPFDSQLIFYFRQLARGDLGRSEQFHQPISALLKQGVIPSLTLTLPIFAVGMVMAITLALVCAFFRDQLVDRALVVLSVALMSINYLVYIIAGQYFLAYKLGAFPVWGYESARYLVLPALIGVVSGLGSGLRFYRTIMLDEMYKDYVRTAFAKGVSKPRVLFVHVLKNAMIPIITNVVIAIPFLFTGSLLLERFFGIPGLGYLTVMGVQMRDYDVVKAVVLIGSFLFIIANLFTDICYALVDPRVRLK